MGRVEGDKKSEQYCTLVYCWCDLNCMRKACERVGVGGEDDGSGERLEFNNFIHELGVDDLPLVGRRFTWYRPNGRARSRLQRALTSSDWCHVWPRCTQFVLDRNILNHCPFSSRIRLWIEDLSHSRSLIVGLKIKLLSKFVEDARRKLNFEG